MKTEDMIEVLERLKGVPSPKTGETQDEFYSRCMGDEDMNGEYPDEAQRSAMCTARWQEPGNPSGAEKAISKAVLDIRDPGIALARKAESLTTEKISEQIMSAVRESIREAVGAEARAAFNRMIGRID